MVTKIPPTLKLFDQFQKVVGWWSSFFPPKSFSPVAVCQWWWHPPHLVDWSSPTLCSNPLCCSSSGRCFSPIPPFASLSFLWIVPPWLIIPLSSRLTLLICSRAIFPSPSPPVSLYRTAPVRWVQGSLLASRSWMTSARRSPSCRGNKQ